MPYDPRPVSRGGNRGVDEQFSRCAPKGMYRVVAVDTFDGSDWVDGDFDTPEEARSYVQERTEGKQMFKMHVYDERGKHLYEGGSF